MDWTNKTILITGGSGSFGSAFSKHLLKNPPKKLIIFSNNWQEQDALYKEMGEPSFVRCIFGDVCKIDEIMSACKGVDILIHAAAVKNLPTCQYNAFSTTDVNVFGTINVVKTAIQQRVNKTLFISTDKSVQAINTYGKCKALAEDLVLYGNVLGADDNIKFSVCRYGNVCGSAGSVVPVFKKFIEQGATELPITHPDMTRFWFKMDDVMLFVEDSLTKMQGGEIFIPKLPSVRITDLAAAFGLPYKVVGIREGEKISETMGQYREDGTLIDSGNNDWFLTVEEIKKTI